MGSQAFLADGNSIMNSPLLIFLRTLLLYLVLEKDIGPRLFLAQAASGEDASGGRLTYYPEFFLSAILVSIAIVHLPRLLRYLVRYPELIVYLVVAAVACFVTEGTFIQFMLRIFSFLDPVLALSLVILYDGVERAKQIITNFFIFAIVVNALAVAAPSMSFMSAASGGDLAGSYRGLMQHRGDLGFMISIAILVFFVYMPRSPVRFALFLVSFLMLAATRSAQGAILTIIGLGVASFLRGRGAMNFARGALLSAATLTFSTIYILAPSLIDDIFDLFGRDASFTGRDRIWAMAIYLIQKGDLLLGHGMLQFTNQILPISMLHLFNVDIIFGTTHSSYLEALYSFGYLGGGLFFLIVARQTLTWAMIVFGFRTINDPLPLVLTVYSVVGGFTAAEKMFLPGAGWLCFMMAKTLMDAERGRRLTPNLTLNEAMNGHADTALEAE